MRFGAQVTADLRIGQAREFAVWQALQGGPAGLEAFFERARIGLVDELTLEALAERQEPAVGFGQALLTHHAREHAHAQRTRVGGEQLVRERRMVRVREAFADAGIHRARQARRVAA